MKKTLLLTAFCWLIAFTSASFAQTLYITEVMSRNNTTLADEDGTFEDWIELYNASASPVNLDGWFLTDNATNLTKWMFPAVTINPGQYLLVWASNKDRRTPGQPLHTNFAISAEGEYVGLLRPDGVTVEHHFSPQIPPMQPDQSYGIDILNPSQMGVLATPTPGAANSGFALTPPTFNHAPHFFSGSVQLQMSAAPGTEIYYFTQSQSNWSTTNVTNAHTPYSGPITVSATTLFKAVARDPATNTYSPPAYIALGKLSTAMQNFSSDLPFFVMDTFGLSPDINNTRLTLVALYDIDPSTGRASTASTPNYTGFGGITIRGNSTAGIEFYKKQFKLDTYGNTAGINANVALLDFSSQNDYVLEAPYRMDRSMLRVPLVFELGRQMGVTTSGNRFVELFMNTQGGDVRADIIPWNGSNPNGVDYRGVYILKHSIRARMLGLSDPLAAADRPAVTTSSPIDDFDSFIFRVDRSDPEKVALTASWGGGDMGVPLQDWPSKEVLPAGAGNYVQTFITAMENAMKASDFTSDTTGWRKFADEDSMINFHIIHLLSNEVDRYRYSFFAHKERGEKLKWGPLWDYDRTMDSNDDRDNDHMAVGLDFDQWGQKLWLYAPLNDAEFTKNYVDRWATLRRTVLSDANIDAIIDRYRTELLEAQARNYIRWPEDVGTNNQTNTWNLLGSGNWSGQVEHLRRWIKERIAFIDTRLVPVPLFNIASQTVPAGHNSTTLSRPARPLSSGQSKIYFTTDGSDPRPEGNRKFANFALWSKGRPAPNYNDGTADSAPLGNAIEYTGQTLTVNKSTVIRARVYDPAYGWDVINFPNDTHNRRFGYWSGINELRLGVLASVPNVIFTEIMYHAPDFGTPAVNGKHLDFVEIKNIHGSTVDLSAFELQGEIAYTFPVGTSLPHGAHLVVASDPVLFMQKYPAFSGTLLGPYKGNLSNSGGRVTLVDPGHLSVYSVKYQDVAPWPISADGFGYSLVPVDPTVKPASPDDPMNWRASVHVGGSPGQDDPTTGVIAKIRINEVMSHTDLPDVDTVELYNPTASPVNIGGWFLSDRFAEPRKYKIPAGTTVPANGYLVLNESHFGAAFLLSEHGEDIYLFSADAGENLTGHIHGFPFEAMANGVSHGAYVTSALNNNEVHIVEMASRTFGSANAAPKVGPVVITEIHYNPAAGGDEFVEIANISGTTVPLYDPANPQNTWKLNGYGFTFPTGVSMPPNSLILITNSDPNTFRTKYSVSPAVPIYQASGNLDNSGETLTLQRPSAPDPVWPFTMSMYTVDRVRYNDKAPWPLEADGLGKSLERLNVSQYGNDPANWQASSVTGGTPGTGGLPPTSPIIATSKSVFTASSAEGFSPDAQTFTVFNTGINTLSYSISDNAAWLSIAPASGTSTGIGNAVTHTLTFNSSALAAGTHNATITVTDTNAVNSPYTMTVTLTQAPAPTAPAAPSSLTATATGPFSINLTWTDNASDEDGFYLERKSGAGVWTQIASLPANATSYPDNSGLNSLTSYQYRLRAHNLAGTSAYSNEASATTTDNFTTLVIPLADNSDDAEEFLTSGSNGKTVGAVNLTSSDLEFTIDVGEGGPQQAIGVRFRNITVPQGYTILNAYITFTCLSAGSADPVQTVTVRGHAHDNAPAFSTSAFNITTRATTTASVPWNLTATWTVGQAYQTPNLAPLLQEIVNRPGWNSGNSAAFIFRDGTKTHIAKANTGTGAPTLTIEYATPAPSSGYNAWKDLEINNGGSKEFDGDADLDGIPNGLEYAFGLDPDNGLSASSPVLPKATFEGGRLALTFTLPATIPADVTYVIEASEHLAFSSPTTLATKTAGSSSWTGSATPSTANGGETVTVTDSVLLTTTPRFLRMKVLIP